ncbi:MAG: hypothetical protein Q4A60_07735 [Pasteurellaceae bacterium]|nr:hypothetical protein [Pasteurellaceae bacterium]
MQITENTIRKIYDFHGVNKHFLSRLPRLLHNENEQFISYIFKSHTQPNSRVVVSFEFVGIQPIIIAIAQGKRINTNEFVNEIASVYEKRDGLKAFERWADQGLLLYKNSYKTLTEPTQSITIRHRKIRRT